MSNHPARNGASITLPGVLPPSVMKSTLAYLSFSDLVSTRITCKALRAEANASLWDLAMTKVMPQNEGSCMNMTLDFCSTKVDAHIRRGCSNKLTSLDATVEAAIDSRICSFLPEGYFDLYRDILRRYGTYSEESFSDKSSLAWKRKKLSFSPNLSKVV